MTKALQWLAAILAAGWFATGCKKDDEFPGYMDLPEVEDLADLDGQRALLERALLVRFTEGGWVAPRRDGAVELEGDSLLWTGLALAVLPCHLAGDLFAAVARSQAARQGALVRYEPLPDKFAGNEVSRDGALGMILGWTSLYHRCPDFVAAAPAAFGDWLAFVHLEGKGALYPGTQAVVTIPFGYAMQTAAWDLGLAAEPANEVKGAAELGLVVDARRIKGRREACYPVHLAALQLYLTARAGKPVTRPAFDLWCDETDGMAMPLADWLCRRRSARLWLAAPAEPYEYRHQRCAWESPDLGDGEETPHLDWLFLRFLAAGGW